MSRIYVDRISPYQSGSVQVDGLSFDTGSLVTTSSFNAYSASQQNVIATLATTGSNSFTGNQTITGGTLLNTVPGLSLNTQVDLFTYNTGSVVSGKSFDIASVGYQDYSGFSGNFFKDAFAVEYANNINFNYYNGFYVNPLGTTMNIVPSGSNLASIRLRDVGGSSQASIFANDTVIAGNTVTIQGDIIATGAFEANVINITPGSEGNGINLYQDGLSRLRFWSGSNQTEVGTWVNLQVNPSNGALEISSWPNNDHFLGFQPHTTQSVFQSEVVFQEPIIGFIGNNVDGANNASFVQNTNYFSDYYGSVLQWRPEFQGGVSRLWLNEKSKSEIQINAWSSSYDNIMIPYADANGTYIADWNGSYTVTPWITIERQQTPVFNRGLNVDGQLSVSQVMKLDAQDPLPSGELGMLAVSGSNLYFHDGIDWIQK